MRYSRLLIPTVKEVPAEAEIPSHQLMIRAGFIRKLASGTYTYLPLGWRSLRKIIQIVREEMDAAGAQEVSMPILQPLELWQATGRDVVFQDIMCQFQDRHGRGNVLAPTAEEVVTSLVAGEVSSYKQLPVNLYQINTKFRDEFRPRFGVLRSREFLMKDAYSFDAAVGGLDESYRKMYEAYCRIFDRAGLTYVSVQAESGGMGGTDTEEFMVPCSAGEDVLVHTDDHAYAANLEKAGVDAPAVDAAALAARRAKAPAPESVHTPGVGSIEAVCKFLGTQPGDMIKTLLYAACYDAPQAAPSRHEAPAVPPQQPRTQTLVCLVRGDHEVNVNKLLHASGATRAELAGQGVIEALTGAAVGFAGPQGLAEKAGMLLVDHAVAAMACGVTGANKTDYHVRNLVPGRDFPLEGPHVVVADLRNAAEGDTYRGRKLVFARGIEVGHVFKLGTKYSRQLGAMFVDEAGQRQPCIMGCYGIGINRILASAIESPEGHDDNGCILPVSIAPFEALVVPLTVEPTSAVMTTAEEIYARLAEAGVDVLIDDRDARPGVKFKDADLLGIPLRITVGEKALKDGKVEIKRRTDAKPALVDAPHAVAEARQIIAEMYARLGKR